MAAAVARLRLSARPRIRIRTRWSASAARSSGEPVRLVAEEPGRGPVEQVAGIVEQHLAPAVGSQHREAGLLSGADGAGGVGLEGDRQVEHAAHAGPDGLGVVEVDRLAGQHDRVDAERVGGADQGAGVAGVTDLGAQGHQRRAPWPGRRGRRPAATSTNEQTATRPAGVTLSLSEARARSSTRRQPRGLRHQRGVPLGGGDGGEHLDHAARPRARPRRPSGRRRGTAAVRREPNDG